MKKILFFMPFMAISLLASCGKSTPSTTYHVVSFDSDGGSFIEAKQVEDGKTAEPPTDPTRPQYKFDGWKLDGAEYTFTEPVKDDIVLKASWTDGPTPTITHKVTFHFNNDSGSGEQTEICEVAEGDDILRPTWEPTFEGNDFIDWYEQQEGGKKYTFPGTMGEEDVNIYAHWKTTPENYTISFSGVNCKAYRAGVSPTSAGYSVQLTWGAHTSDKFNVVLVPDTDYHLPDSISVLFNGQPGILNTDYEYNPTNKSIVIKKKGDALINLIAIPDATTHKITFNGTSPLVEISVEEGSLVSEGIPEVPAKTGYTPIGWCTDEAGTKLFDFETIKIYQNYTLYPGYEKNVTITFMNDGQTYGDPVEIEKGIIIPSGEIPTDPTKQDYTFAGWGSDTSGEHLVDLSTTKFYEDTTLHANWTGSTTTKVNEEEFYAAIEMKNVHYIQMFGSTEEGASFIESSEKATHSTGQIEGTPMEIYQYFDEESNKYMHTQCINGQWLPETEIEEDQFNSPSNIGKLLKSNLEILGLSQFDKYTYNNDKKCYYATSVDEEATYKCELYFINKQLVKYHIFEDGNLTQKTACSYNEIIPPDPRNQ